MRATWKVAALLFCSGACALIYQTVWMRQFRLIFGASTAATAAVLAIFMGGLGLGSAILGKRADAQPNPLRFYGALELLIATAAALSQPFLWLVAKIYFATGGSVTLGLLLASIVRLVLATIVLGAATVLMGGTLPAAARAVESATDDGRRRVSLLYGANTLGAVAGTLASTFYMLEHLGNRWTLFAAVILNAAIGLIARVIPSEARDPHRKVDRVIPSEARDPHRKIEGDPSPSTRLRMTPSTRLRMTPSTRLRMTPSTRLRMTLLAAAIVGFAFLLMELVWYRMLAPLLGGSTFTFGLILAIALLGIGLGGAAYAFWSGNRQATAGGFALTCALEALAIAVPFALGDRLAVFELYLRSLGTLGFGGFVMAWTIVTLIVVLPAAFVSGIQFPLLISLLGRGDDNVGSDVGAAYAWNTAGAIAGSLAGGFGLLPLMTAPGAWRLVVAILAILSVIASWRALPIAAIAAACLFALGPTAVWRHAGIGAGRATTADSANARTEWMYDERRALLWDVDGRESSVGLSDGADIAFIVNGKADGSARGDAGTQVMAGLVPAILHRHPQRALVVGLGTGSTAGWLGAVAEMQRVDVVELEPAILRVAQACSEVNHDVLHNAKVHVRIGDAREVLLATRDRYDIIFSEPSNPYRAGIASLFTQEFYRAATARLQPGGIFAQWVQTYDVDAQTVRTIYATLASVFAHVDTWTTDEGDLLLVASPTSIPYDFERLRARVATEPFRSAMSHVWRKESLEGFIAHFLARDTLSRAIAHAERAVNTDDRTLIEFGFARGLGAESRFSMDDLTALARARAEDHPIGTGSIDWRTVAANRASIPWVNALVANATAEDQARHRIAGHADNLAQAAADWRADPFTPVNSGELALVAEALADSGSAAAEPFAEQLRRFEATDADAILAKLRFRQSRLNESAGLLQRVFVESHHDPWPKVDLMGHSLDLALNLAHIRSYSEPLLQSLEMPFAAGQWEDTRKYYRFLIAHEREGCGPRAVRALRALEPWPVWNEAMLKMRRDCYQTTMMPLAKRADRDYESFRAAEPAPFNARITPAPSGSSSNPR